MGESKSVYRVLVGKPEEKIPLRKPKNKWEDNIKMNYQGVGCEDVDFIDMAQDWGRCRALVNAVMNLRVP
jgi:hypothetical protein